MSKEATIKWEKMALVSQDMFCTINAGGIYTFASEASKYLVGYRNDELLGQYLTTLVHPEDIAFTKEAIRESIGRKEKKKFKNRLLHKNGNIVYVLWTMAWSQEDGTLYCLAHNITEQEVSVDTLTTIFDSITDAFLTIDRDWQITYMNKEAERLLPFDSTRHIGVNIWELYPEEAGGIAQIQCQKAFDTNQSVTYTLPLKKYGKWFKVKAFPFEGGLSIFFDDVTEKINAQSEAEKLAVVASKTNNGVLIVNKEGFIEWVNDGFTRLHGYTSEEALGKKPSVLLHHPCADPSLYEPIEERLNKGESVSFEVLNRKKDGDWLWVSVEISPVADEYGDQKYVIIQTDITALKTSELDLTRLADDLYKQKSDLQQFSYMVSHNLRSPVSNIQGLTDLLIRSDRHSEVYDQSLAYLKKSITKLDTILMDMNAILGIQDSKGSIEIKKVEVKEALELAFSSFKERLKEIGAIINIDIPETVGVKANKAYLHSIFYNLISNSLKYRSENRTLEICVSISEITSDKVAISFSDNGSGFDIDKAKNHIFKLYKRFHHGYTGKGMGLFLVKSHVESLGGHVEVTSKVDVGTKFSISLPEMS